MERGSGLAHEISSVTRRVCFWSFPTSGNVKTCTHWRTVIGESTSASLPCPARLPKSCAPIRPCSRFARDNLERRSRQDSYSQRYWDAWRKLLDGPLEHLSSLLVEDSERMTALRQATPFAGVDETTAVLPEGWRDRLILLTGENTRFVRGW